MEKENKVTLDDIAFEGRNQEYGAYVLRKSYLSRLIKSFVFSLIIFFILIFINAIVLNHRNSHIYNSGSPLRAVGVNLPHLIFQDQLQGNMRSSTHAIPVIPDKLVDDLSDAQDEDLTNESNGSDTTSIAESVTGGNDAGTSSGSVEGVEGDVYGSADVAPQFPGGVIAMQEYIKTNMRYPKDHSVRSASGSIMIYVIITKEGFVRDVKVIKGIQPELDAEAVRVVRAMPQWKPALRGNHPVNVKCIIPIKVSPL